MSISDLYGTYDRNNNLEHFAVLVRVAVSDGEISKEEKEFLDRVARKLEISETDYQEIIKAPLRKYQMEPPVTYEKRLERLYDLLRVIFADHVLDDIEMKLMKRYALALGFSPKNVDRILEKSVAIFSGKIDFEDYLMLLNK